MNSPRLVIVPLISLGGSGGFSRGFAGLTSRAGAGRVSVGLWAYRNGELGRIRLPIIVILTDFVSMAAKIDSQSLSCPVSFYIDLKRLLCESRFIKRLESKTKEAAMSDFEHLTKADAKEWADLRLPARQRLAASCKHLIDNGTLQRADIMRIGEVSQPQASLDIKAIIAAAPELMEYDKQARCYKLTPAEAA